jgi:hypothetical protein
MRVKSILAGLAALSLAGFDNPRIEKVGDFTGDGISDIMIRDNWGLRYLFVGQKDSTYLLTLERDDKGVKYFAGSKTYFFDGKFYRELPQTRKGKK